MNFGITLLAAVPEGRVFGLDQQTFIDVAIQLFNACILAAALGYILYKPVREFMEKRTARIQGEIDDAAAQRAQADALKAQYEKKLAQIDLERAEILEAARLAASERSKQILDEARGEAAAIKRRTQESIADERERLAQEVRLQIIEVSSLMAAKFVEHAIDESTQDRLFDETMAQLEDARWLS